MPAVLRDLGNLPLYGWAFSAAALAMIGTIPIVGSATDRFGAKPLVVATAALYFVGLLVSALAPSMAVLVVGRFVQGAASGSAYALSLGTRRQDAVAVGPATGAGADGHLLAAAWAARPTDRRSAGRHDRLAMGVRGARSRSWCCRC